MHDEIKQELLRARQAYHLALREYDQDSSEETRQSLDVAGRYLAAAVSEHLAA